MAPITMHTYLVTTGHVHRKCSVNIYTSTVGRVPILCTPRGIRRAHSVLVLFLLVEGVATEPRSLLL